MANLKWEQIQTIVIKNPNKETVEKGRESAKKLMRQGLGIDYKDIIRTCDEFSNPELHKIQKEWAISNKDFWERLLAQESMVFSARGGSQHFNMSDSNEAVMHELLSNVQFGFNLRNWVKNFALQAYRWDPMSIIFMEIEEAANVDSDGSIGEPNVYPTYKSIFCIYDYDFHGRKVEYVAFRLKAHEAREYGIKSEKLKDMKPDQETDFYRVVDDVKDIIVEKDGETVTLLGNDKIKQKNPVALPWKKFPGFMVSNLVRFNNTKEMVSPVDPILELSDCFLYDRSIRDLQKKYHGFAKAIEPLMQCPTCLGNKYVGADPCPSCTPPGQKQGTGYMKKTRISDVARFPLEILSEGAFDWKRIFGYVTPDIESWEKQDRTLDDFEQLAELTYWATIRMKRPQAGQTGPGGPDKTATEVNSNDAPREARLNATADWAEDTENKIADLIGQYWFTDNWKGSNISLGRDYILKTAEQYLDIYEGMRSKGAPDFMLDDAAEKVIRAMYQNNPIMMNRCLKMLDVEPFPHIKISEAKNIITDFNDYSCKLYFGEWSNTVLPGEWIMKKADDLKKQLLEYVKAKALTDPAEAAAKAADPNKKVPSPSAN